MATMPCMPASGPHHHHTDNHACVMTPRPFFMLWCGRRDARQLRTCVCHTPCCIPHSASSACGCTHFVLIFLEAHSCPLSLSSSSFPTISCGGKGEQGGRKQSSYAEQAWAGMGRQWDEHHQPRSALACHVLLDADAKHTQYHTSPTSLPPRRSPPISSSSHHFPSLSLSHDATQHHRTEEGECTTMEQSQYACHGSKRRWCGVRWERMQQ